jgi:hypothetical protein
MKASPLSYQPSPFPHRYYQLVYTLTNLLPPPLDSSPNALRIRNHIAIARVAALPISPPPSRAQSLLRVLARPVHRRSGSAEDLLRLLRENADYLELVMRLNTQYASMVRTSPSVNTRLVHAVEAIDGAATEHAWTHHVAEQSVPKVADRDNERLQAARSAARLADALPAAPPPQGTEELRKRPRNDTNSHKVAFETPMEEHPSSQTPTSPDEPGPRERLREAIAGSRLAGREVPANGRESLGGQADLASRLNVRMDAKAPLPHGAERLVPDHPIGDPARRPGSKAAALANDNPFVTPAGVDMSSSAGRLRHAGACRYQRHGWRACAHHDE